MGLDFYLTHSLSFDSLSTCIALSNRRGSLRLKKVLVLILIFLNLAIVGIYCLIWLMSSLSTHIAKVLSCILSNSLVVIVMPPLIQNIHYDSGLIKLNRSD